MQAARLPLQNYFGPREATIFSKQSRSVTDPTTASGLIGHSFNLTVSFPSPIPESEDPSGFDPTRDQFAAVPE